MQERRNSIANALELRLSCTNTFWCNKNVTPLLTHLSYISLVLTHLYACFLQTVPIESVDVTRQQMTKSLKPILNLVIIVVMYAACYWPYCWATFLASGDPAGFMNNELFMKIYLGLLVMLLANCMLNPVVYALRFKPFTVAFKLMFGMIPPSERHIAIEGIQH